MRKAYGGLKTTGLGELALPLKIVLVTSTICVAAELTTTLATGGAGTDTLTSTLAERPRALAEIVDVPTDTPVMRPVDETVTLGLEDAHWAAVVWSVPLARNRHWTVG
jgi:hypothetical protein